MFDDYLDDEFDADMERDYQRDLKQFMKHATKEQKAFIRSSEKLMQRAQAVIDQLRWENDLKRMLRDLTKMQERLKAAMK